MPSREVGSGHPARVPPEARTDATLAIDWSGSTGNCSSRPPRAVTGQGATDNGTVHSLPELESHLVMPEGIFGRAGSVYCVWFRWALLIVDRVIDRRRQKLP